jgi:propanediol dehydratase small subunit
MPNEDILEIYGSEKVYRLACEKLAQVADIKEQCDKADAQYDAIPIE